MDLQENPAVADIKARQAADRRVSLSPKECQIEGPLGESTYRAKVASGALHRYLDGARVRITAASFYAHLIELRAAPRTRRFASRRRASRRSRVRGPRLELEGLRKGPMRSAPARPSSVGRPAKSLRSELKSWESGRLSGILLIPPHMETARAHLWRKGLRSGRPLERLAM